MDNVILNSGCTLEREFFTGKMDKAIYLGYQVNLLFLRSTSNMTIKMQTGSVICYDFVRSWFDGETFISKAIKRWATSNKKSLAVSACRLCTIRNPLISILGEFLEEHLWTWGVSRPILTPQGLSSKAAAHQHSGWTQTQNSSAVTSRLSRKKGGKTEVYSLQTVWAIFFAVVVVWETGDYYCCTWSKVGCFPSCCYCLSQGPLVLWVTVRQPKVDHLVVSLSNNNSVK